MKKIKLVYIYHNFIRAGGIPKIQAFKANYFAEAPGYETILITDKINENETFYHLSKNLTIYYLDCSEPDYPKKVSDLLCNIKADIVSCIAGDEEFFYLYKIQDGSRKVAEFRTNYRAIKGFSNLKYNFRGWLAERISFIKFLKAARKYNAFVTLTQDDKNFLQRYLRNLYVISNPLTFHNTQAKKPENIAIAVGRLEGVKGFDRLIDIWKIVSEEIKGWKLHIFGDGPLKELLIQKIKKLHLTEQVFINEPTKEIDAKYAQSSIHLMTSLYEGFGNVLTEAMASEIPSVAFDCGGGPAELIENGVTGFLVKPNDNLTFAKRIIELIQNEELRIEMGESAKAKSETYRVEIIMSSWHKLFKELAEKT